ncbi:MAG: molybdopterin converting factor small subunit [Nevskiales bacterium]
MARLNNASVESPEKVMARVQVQYFAVLRERAGRSSEQVETQGNTARELFAELDQRYRFPRLASLKVAINDEFRDWDTRISDGDSVVFIPPVAGG